MKAPLVVGLGRVGVAISGLAPNLPQSNAPAAELAALAPAPAPGVAVALRAALTLGCRARAVGTHGADLLGQLARTALREAGIDTELLRAVGTSACEIVTTAADGSMRARYAGELGEPVGFDAEAAITGASALLIDGTASIDQLRTAERARAHKIPVIFDVGELRDGTSELIAASDIMIASERAASELAPRGELTDALEEIIALGPRAVVITLGDERRDRSPRRSDHPVPRVSERRARRVRRRLGVSRRVRGGAAQRAAVRALHRARRGGSRRCRCRDSDRGRRCRVATTCSHSCERGANVEVARSLQTTFGV